MHKVLIDDIDEIVRTGERVPMWMSVEDLVEAISDNPVYDGERIVEQDETED